MIVLASRVATLSLMFTFAAGCGGDSAITADDPGTSSTAVVDTSLPDENETSTTVALESSDDTRLPLANETDLVILGSDEAAVEEAVAAFDGTIVLAEEAGVFQVRFPVGSLSELREIESELERLGFATQLAFADDQPPPADGDS